MQTPLLDDVRATVRVLTRCKQTTVGEQTNKEGNKQTAGRAAV